MANTVFDACRDCGVSEEIIDALCEIGNTNPISPEELKAARDLYEIKTKTFNPDDYNYESPITVTMQQVMYNIMQEQEKYILKQIHNCGVTVNKEELTKALAYDRDQYYKGFEDGREWVSAKIYAAYKALLDGFTDEAIGYLGELLDDHKEVNEE